MSTTTRPGGAGSPAPGPLHDDLLATYLTAPDRLREAVAGLDDDQLAARPSEDARSLLETVVHLADTELHGLARIRRVIAEPGTRLEGWDREAWASALTAVTPVDAALDLFAALRRAGASALRHATPAQRAHTCIHPVHGPISLDGLLQLLTLHAEQHIDQIRRLRGARGW
jgi:hypothetical protein